MYIQRIDVDKKVTAKGIPVRAAEVQFHVSVDENNASVK